MTYLNNVFLSVLTGMVAYVLFVTLVLAAGLTDTSFAKIFALVSAVLMSAVLVISRRAKERSNG